MKRIFLIFALMLIAAPSFAANGITTGALVTLSNFKGISIRAPFTGDDNGNATAVVEYKAATSSTWLLAYTPMIDRRTVVGNMSFSNAANVNQARGSIVGLTANTSYNVRVTWTDADGVTGTNPRTDTLSTVTYTPPVTGPTVKVGPANGCPSSTMTACDYSTPNAAVTALAATGGTLDMYTGSYSGFTISTSGTSSAYFYLKVHSGETATISAGATALTINANYWRIAGLTIADQTNSAVIVGNGQNHIYIEDLAGGNVATSDGSPGNYYGAFVLGNATNVYILRNSFTCNVFTKGDDSTPFIDGVYIGTVSSVVIEGNTFAGTDLSHGFWDSVGNGTNNTLTNMENVDIDGNTFTNYHDDGTELDGGGINVRFWSNILSTATTYVYSGDCVSLAPINVGPAYVFRNICHVYSANSAGIKQDGNTFGSTTFIFHNTIDTSGAAGGSRSCFPGTFFGTIRNNICVAAGSVFENNTNGVYAASITPSTRNYDLGYSSIGNAFAYPWNGGPTVYSTVNDFRITGEEINGDGGDPRFGVDYSIAATSPAYHTGVALPNFNGADSLWPTGGNAPDIGAFNTNTTLPGTFTISPSSSTQNSTLTLIFTGSGTSWVNGSTTALFNNPDITVNSTTVSNSTLALVNITISGTAQRYTADVNMITVGP